MGEKASEASWVPRLEESSRLDISQQSQCDSHSRMSIRHGIMVVMCDEFSPPKHARVDIEFSVV